MGKFFVCSSGSNTFTKRRLRKGTPFLALQKAAARIYYIFTWCVCLIPSFCERDAGAKSEEVHCLMSRHVPSSTGGVLLPLSDLAVIPVAFVAPSLWAIVSAGASLRDPPLFSGGHSLTRATIPPCSPPCRAPAAPFAQATGAASSGGGVSPRRRAWRRTDNSLCFPSPACHRLSTPPHTEASFPPAGAMVQIVFVRHGEKDRGEPVHLNEEGKARAELMVDYILHPYGEFQRPDFLYIMTRLKVCGIKGRGAFYNTPY